jgi:hypothetical protein
MAGEQTRTTGELPAQLPPRLHPMTFSRSTRTRAFQRCGIPQPGTPTATPCAGLPSVHDEWQVSQGAGRGRAQPSATFAHSWLAVATAGSRRKSPGSRPVIAPDGCVSPRMLRMVTHACQAVATQGAPT